MCFLHRSDNPFTDRLRGGGALPLPGGGGEWGGAEDAQGGQPVCRGSLQSVSKTIKLYCINKIQIQNFINSYKQKQIIFI